MSLGPNQNWLKNVELKINLNLKIEMLLSAGEETEISVDEEYTKVKFEKFPSLKPTFDRSGSGTVTAANASTLNDGAAAMVLMSKESLEEHQLKPLAKIIGWSVYSLCCLKDILKN